ncbi:SulP family inorganic anion transporter, partial [Escherichia coli]|nr:SulP family inorganic anion transporter [Escherichia coli]
LERLWEAPQRLAELHWPTVALSVATVVVYLVTKRYRPTWPAAMLAILVTTASVWLLHLQEMDVAVVGLTQGGFPQFQAPQFELGEVRE